MAPPASSKIAATDGPPTGQALAAGALAGLVAGAVMSLYLITLDLTLGLDVWAGMKFAGYPVLGNRALLPGFHLVPVAVGLLCHLAVAALWGAVFGYVAYARPAATTVVAGAGWGIVAWLVMFRVVLPSTNLGPVAAALPFPGAIVEHLLFGLALAIALLALQSTKRQAVKPRISTGPKAPRARAS